MFFNENKELDASIWGPHYWFFLHTISLTYPKYPDSATKRKYYDFIMNLPLFIPNNSYSKKMSFFLNEYPVTPYLDKRDSFIYWVYFMHNKINNSLGKEEISFLRALDDYYDNYKPKIIQLHKKINVNKNYVFMGFLVLMCIVIYFLL